MTGTLIEVFVGLSLLLWGLGSLFYKKSFTLLIQAFSDIERHKFPVYSLLSFILILGLLTISFHNYWAWEIPVIVSFLGWAMIFKSLLWIFFPKSLSQILKRMSPFLLKKPFRWAYAFFVILMGLVILSFCILKDYIPF